MALHKRTLFEFAAAALVAPVFPLTASPAAAVPPEPPEPRVVQGFCQNVPDSYQPFTDIDGNTFEFNIRCLAAAEITRGGAGSLRPDQYGPGLSVPRDAMASFIARLIDTAGDLDTGESIRELPAFDGEVNFRDVSPSSVHAQSIDRLAEAGIVQGGPGGRPSNEYGPALDVTRAQMASLIHNTLVFMTAEDVGSGQQDYFTDDENTVPHEPRINALASLGIAVGDGQDTFNPFQSVPRDQMSGFLTRSLAFLEERGDITPLPYEDIRVSPDTEETLNADPNPDNTTADDRSYTVSGLVDGQQYRITLFVEENVATRSDVGIQFADPDGDGLADTGNPTADITQVNGQPAENNAGDGTATTPTDATKGGKAVFTADSTTATFVVDGDDNAESVRPVVHRNGGGDNSPEDGGSSPRLEVFPDDRTSIEPFDLGGVASFTAPTA